MEIALCGKSARGRVTLIDDEDYPRVAGYRWYLMTTGYVQGYHCSQPKARVLLHRLLTDAPAELVVDHINHDQLDNRRRNLRVVTPKENALNRREGGSGKRTSVPGVLQIHERYLVVLESRRLMGRRKYVGSFWTFEEAKAAAEEARRSERPRPTECRQRAA